MAKDSPSTREEILRVALERFAKQGFHATSVQQIADAVGVTKTAVLYHFPEKADLLAALAAPMLDQLDACIAAASMLRPVEARTAILEGLVEVWLGHRYLLQMNLADVAWASSPTFARFRDGLLRAAELVAGPRADLAARIRATQAVGMLADPIVVHASAPTELLRAEVLGNARRLFASDELSGHADASRPRRGRKPALDAGMTREAERLRRRGRSADEIAEQLGVSRATVYRHLGSSQK